MVLKRTKTMTATDFLFLILLSFALLNLSEAFSERQ